MQSNDDIIFQYMLETDIDDIENLCQISHKHYKICNTNHFWVEKFKHDHVSLDVLYYPHTVSDWIDLYRTPLDKSMIINYFLNMDIYTLFAYCRTSKRHAEICRNQFFWIKKFKKDHLPLHKPYPKTMREWFYRYSQMEEQLLQMV